MKNIQTATSPDPQNHQGNHAVRLAAEHRYADELARLAQADTFAKPAGWRLSPRAVRQFILGDAALQVSRKFYGDDPLVDRAIVTLMGHQGLMLVGEPGTAKSLLSELLAAAISGDSGLTVQGTAGTTEDHLKYSWNYALLLAEGPSRKALVPSPMYQAMRAGKLVRFEEITRCPPEIQDVLISLMSDKQIMVPELSQNPDDPDDAADAASADANTPAQAPSADGSRLFARRGFNIIATANLRDRGVHEMSSALKRRFNFETVRPIRDHAFEVELVTAQLQRDLAGSAVPVQVPRDVIALLVTTFQELRSGQTAEGTAIKGLDAVMSTAEAVSVAYAAALQAQHFNNGVLTAREIAGQLQGVVLKDSQDDVKRVRHYFETVVRERGKRDAAWKAFFDAARGLWS